jgi:hypothetical protein
MKKGLPSKHRFFLELVVTQKKGFQNRRKTVLQKNAQKRTEPLLQIHGQEREVYRYLAGVLKPRGNIT